MTGDRLDGDCDITMMDPSACLLSLPRSPRSILLLRRRTRGNYRVHPDWPSLGSLVLWDLRVGVVSPTCRYS